MRLQGELNLNHANDDYIMFYQGRNVNINDILYSVYVDKSDVSIKISNKHSGKILFDATGEIYKDKIQPKYYSYYIDGQDLGEVLWDNVGRKLVIEINNVTKE